MVLYASLSSHVSYLTGVDLKVMDVPRTEENDGRIIKSIFDFPTYDQQKRLVQVKLEVLIRPRNVPFEQCSIYLAASASEGRADGTVLHTFSPSVSDSDMVTELDIKIQRYILVSMLRLSD